MTIFAMSGARIFDGETMHLGKAVVVDGPRVGNVISESELPSGIDLRRLHGGILAPGYIDVQVNGGGGVLLNADPNMHTVMYLSKAHRMHGTTGLLPTVISDLPDVVASSIEAVRLARDAGDRSVLGIHVEGPFLDPLRRGAHDTKFFRSMTEADVQMLTTADCGAMMLTLAPNKVPPAVIRRLVERGVLVSMGHSEALHYEVRAALDAGATSFTHLFNAMSQITGREPGMVGAALTDEKSFIGVIADGHHVHDVSLRLAFSSTSLDRFMLVSDAMPPAAGGPDSFVLQGREVRRLNDRLELPDGTLAGSNLTMDKAVQHCVRYLQMPIERALQMASRNPARFLGRKDLGIIAPGALASLVHLDDQLNVFETWVEGR